MSRDFPGPHHCIATARAVSESLYGVIKARCIAGGGNLTLADLEDANVGYLDGLASKFDWFEALNRDCMKASACIAPPMFGREMIFASVLATACGREFDSAFGGSGMTANPGWRRPFFALLAQFMREHSDGDVDGKMIGAYVEATRKFGAKLSLDNLAAQRSVQRILQRCVAGLGLVSVDAQTAAATGLSSFINSALAAKTDGTHDRPCAVTQGEAAEFLLALRQKWERV